MDVDATRHPISEDGIPLNHSKNPGQCDGQSPRSTRSADPEKSAPKRRSCNSCRQQKLRCDVVQSPFKPCSRCRRTGKDCKVETTFQPDFTPKHSKMQLEIEELRRQLSLAQGQGVATIPQLSLNLPSIEESVSPQNTSSRKLGDHTVSERVLDELYKEFFKHYHPFLPFLNPEESATYYFQLSPLLGWSIVVVAARRYEVSLLKSLLPDFVKLLWSTIQEMQQSYHVSKALCLLCFWPLPETQNFKGPTYHLSGIMMQIANQNMLHVPTQTQLMPFRNIPELEQRDRVVTWVACNIVAQSVSNVYGFLPQTNFRFILGSNQVYLSSYHLPEPLLKQLKIAEYCHTLTDMLYCNNFDSSGLPSPDQRARALDQLDDTFERLQANLDLKSTSDAFSSIDTIIPKLHLLAAKVQLHAFEFFLPLEEGKNSRRLYGFYADIRTFLQIATDFETSFGYLFEYCSIIISRTVLSCIMGLLKILNSPMLKSSSLEVEFGKALFNTALLSARRMSVQKDDFEYRMSTTIPEMWRDLGAGAPWDASRPNPLILKVQSRMSFSHGYDCLYHHLQQLKAKKVPAESQDISGPTQAQSIPFASGLGVADQLNSTLLPPPMDDSEFFNTMDWILGDMPLLNYEYMDFNTSV